jgi:hypothetical protein
MLHLPVTSQVRILVVVLDVEKIPKKADVCAISSVYRLFSNLINLFRMMAPIYKMMICWEMVIILMEETM